MPTSSVLIQDTRFSRHLIRFHPVLRKHLPAGGRITFSHRSLSFTSLSSLLSLSLSPTVSSFLLSPLFLSFATAGAGCKLLARSRRTEGGRTEEASPTSLFRLPGLLSSLQGAPIVFFPEKHLIYLRSSVNQLHLQCLSRRATLYSLFRSQSLSSHSLRREGRSRPWSGLGTCAAHGTRSKGTRLEASSLWQRSLSRGLPRSYDYMFIISPICLFGNFVHCSGQI